MTKKTQQSIKNWINFFYSVPYQIVFLKPKAHDNGDCDQSTGHNKFLTDRIQRVIVDEEISIWNSVLSGVPDGSILVSMLLLI